MSSFQFKGSNYTLIALQLYASDLDQFKSDLDQKVSENPNFLQSAPMVLDLTGITEEISLDPFLDVIKNQKLNLVGAKVGDYCGRQVLQKGITLLNNASNSKKTTREQKSIDQSQLSNKQVKPIEKEETQTKPVVTKEAEPNTMVINEKVRGGQQIFNPNGDIIITASVASGAEIIATGNITALVPGSGKLIAGCRGNKDAIIFCTKLTADLISIAGVYQLCDNINNSYKNSSVKVNLETGNLRYTLL